MDSFEDLENPPISIQNVVNNRWLNSSFKETVSICYFHNPGIVVYQYK